VLASSCAARPQHPALPYPPAADLKVEPEPVAAPAIATSEQAYEDYNEAVAAWGKRGWAAVARLCRYSKAMGMAVECPVAEHSVVPPAGS
jgi:hypothetical protein